MPMVRVVNNLAKSLGLPAFGSFEAVDIPPGGKNVDVDHIAGVTEHPGVKLWIEKGWLTLDAEPGAESKPEGPKPPPSLKSYKPEGAILLVEAETNLETLAMWAENENRSKVQAAIDTRVAILTGGGSASETDPTD